MGMSEKHPSCSPERFGYRPRVVSATRFVFGRPGRLEPADDEVADQARKADRPHHPNTPTEARMDVTIYSKPNCQPCAATKRALTNRGIQYVEADATDPANLDAFAELGLREAPVVIVRPAGADHTGEDIWSGFRPDKIAALTV